MYWTEYQMHGGWSSLGNSGLLWEPQVIEALSRMWSPKHCNILLLLLGQLECMILFRFWLFFVDWNLNPVGLLPKNDLPMGDVVCWFNTSLPGHHLGPLCT